MLNQSLFSIVILLRATVSEATITVGILDVIFAPVKGGGRVSHRPPIKVNERMDYFGACDKSLGMIIPRGVGALAS